MIPLLAFCLLPPSLWQISPSSMNPAERVLVESLQGITSDSKSKIWVETAGVQAQVLQKLKASGWKVEVAPSAWSLLQTFRSRVKGAIIYKLGTPSFNVAMGLCGPLHFVAIDESIATKCSLKTLLDVRGMTESQAYLRFHQRYRQGIVVEQSTNKVGFLRDFAIRHHAFVMDTADSSFRRKVVQESGKAPLIFGWGTSESGWVSDISLAGGSAVAADWCTNLSILEALQAPRLAPRKPFPIHAQQNLRYVAFVMSDGDNLQWQTGSFATDPHWYGSPYRGSFPFTWEVSPLLAQFAPRVYNEIISHATPNDDFIGGAGAPGYVFPAYSPDREALARSARKSFRESKISIASVLNANEGSLSDCEPLLALPEVSAVVYKDYSPYHGRNGQVAWFHGKPVVSYRFVLWANLLGTDELVSKIEHMPLTGEGRLALINVHAWSFDDLGGPIEATRRVIGRLGPKTKVITASQLIQIIKEEHGH